MLNSLWIVSSGFSYEGHSCGMMRCLQLELSVLNTIYMLTALAIAAREAEKGEV